MKWEPKAKLLATCISGLMCGWLMFLTQGAHGIGWFLLSVMLIWGVFETR